MHPTLPLHNQKADVEGVVAYSNTIHFRVCSPERHSGTLVPFRIQTTRKDNWAGYPERREATGS